jgi:hypothetical protein
MYINPEEGSQNSKVTESEITSEDEVSMELATDNLKFSCLELLGLKKNHILTSANFLDMSSLAERELRKYKWKYQYGRSWLSLKSSFVPHVWLYHSLFSLGLCFALSSELFAVHLI